MLAAGREGAKLSEELVLRGFISPEEIRVAEVKGVVDTGATPVGGAGIESGARSRRGKCTIQDDTMKIWLPKNRKELKKHLSDPLFKNAYFLMLISMLSLLGIAKGTGIIFIGRVILLRLTAQTTAFIP